MNTRAQNCPSMRNENTVGENLIPTSLKKPQIPEIVSKKWHELTNLFARMVDDAAVIIIRFSEENGIVIAASSTAPPYFQLDEPVYSDTGLLLGIAECAEKKRGMVEIHSTPAWSNNPLMNRGIDSVFAATIYWEDGVPFGSIAAFDPDKIDTVVDFTTILSRVIALIEYDLSSLMMYEELRVSLSMQEMLIKEAHHRINNHLTLLISYIQLHVAEERRDKDIGGVLLDIENRIRSIAVIHEELHSTSSDKRGIRFDTYCSRLTRSLIANVGGTAISCVCEIEKLHLPIELAVSLGLIISELVTNSIKYAFTGVEVPEITITVHRVTDNRLHLCFRDNGIGLPNGFEIEEATTLGINLIKLQVAQLHGEIEVDGTCGTEFSIDVDG